MPSGPDHSNRVAIVGASSLRGKELKQVLEDRHFPAGDFLLLDESVLPGTLTEAAGEPTFIRALEEDTFDGVQFAFFAGGVAEAERNWPVAERAGATVIDLTGAVAALDRATTWIPSLATALPPPAVSTVRGSSRPRIYYSPAPPVIIACMLSAGLKNFSPRRIVLLLFPPVSERDQAGVEELESQTTNLLSFREIARPVFDAQVAFNLLSRYGPSSTPALAKTRAAIAGEVARYLVGRAPVPAIQLVQAPVFYGYAFAAFAEFASPPDAEQLRCFEAALAKLGAQMGAADDPAPTNVSVAGESEIQLAPIEVDPGIAEGVWFWGAADNLRLAAVNAVRIAEEIVAKSPA